MEATEQLNGKVFHIIDRKEKREGLYNSLRPELWMRMVVPW